MKLSELIESLQHIARTEGDMNVTISTHHSKPAGQDYVISSPSTVVVEPYPDGNEVSIRDWLY